MEAPIVTAIISACVTLIVTFVPLLLKYLSDRKKYKKEIATAEDKVNLTVSTGVAIGYYYNFIKPIFEKLTVNDEIEISIDSEKPGDPEIKRTFKTDNVEIQIILPSELTKAGIEEMRDHAKRFLKGNVLRKNGLRDFAIKFFTDDKNDRLIIVDVANPLNGVGQYLANLAEFKSIITTNGVIIDGEDTQEFRMRQRKEIDNFTEVIRFYAHTESFGDKKLLFQKV
jgi:hypothetical protein